MVVLVGGPDVFVGGGVNDEVCVNEAVGIDVNVNVAEGVTVGVREGVNVGNGELVTDWKVVGDAVIVAVIVGVVVGVGVLVIVCVATDGVMLCVGLSNEPIAVGATFVGVKTIVGVGVARFGSGASANASHPMQ